MPFRPCLCGCGALVEAGKSYLPAHAPAKRRPGSTRRWRRTRKRIFRRDGYRCTECGAVDRLEADHVKPVAAGGTDDDDNLRTLCFTCNRSR